MSQMSLKNRIALALGNQARIRRFALFRDLFETVPGRIKILDVGGTPYYWQTVRLFEQTDKEVEIVLLNLQASEVSHPHMTSVVGDARDLSGYDDASFDIVYSNSVIEHVGTYEDQRRMASEIRRVGKRYFVQTPNRYFPIEPHVALPGFQFLPLWARAWLLRHVIELRQQKKRITDPQEALEWVQSIRMLTKRELQDLFPEGTIVHERFCGLTKSFMVYGGFEQRA